MTLPVVLLARRIVTESGCWEWAGARCLQGYGTVRWHGKSRKVHRVVAHLAHGLDLEDRWTFACHRCDNPPCFNPEHLFIGTPADNNRDRDAKGRNRPAYTHKERPDPPVHPRTRPCQVCGAAYEPHVDHRGRSIVCSAECLGKLRSVLLQGNGSRLTPEDVRVIRQELAAGKRGTGARLADQYGIHRSTVTMIKQGKLFGWVQ